MTSYPVLSYADAVAFLVAAIRARIAVLLVGSPGIGKTALVRHVARVVGLPPHELIGSTCDPTDVGGIPWVRHGDKGATLERAPIARIQACADAAGLLFLDELSCAPPTVQAALLRLVLDYAAGDVALHPDSRIVAACNPVEQAPGGFELSSPLVGRLTIATLAPSLDEVRAFFRGDGARTVEAYQPTPYDAATSAQGYARLARDFAATSEVEPSLIVLDPPAASVTSGEPWGAPRSWERGLRGMSQAIVSSASVQEQAQEPCLHRRRRAG